jgi:hypothetical protein
LLANDEPSVDKLNDEGTFGKDHGNTQNIVQSTSKIGRNWPMGKGTGQEGTNEVLALELDLEISIFTNV